MNPSNRDVAGDQLAQSAAVHVVNARQVYDELATSAFDIGSNALFELPILPKHELAVEVQHCNIFQFSLSNIHLFFNPFSPIVFLDWTPITITPITE